MSCWCFTGSGAKQHNATCRQGDHLSGKAGNIREFDSCQGNVGDFTKSQGSVREKILSGKSGLNCYCKLVHCWLCWACAFHFGFGTYTVAFLLTITLVPAWYELHLTWEGVPRTIREFHIVWRVVTLHRSPIPIFTLHRWYTTMYWFWSPTFVTVYLLLYISMILGKLDKLLSLNFPNQLTVVPGLCIELLGPIGPKFKSPDLKKCEGLVLSSSECW